MRLSRQFQICVFYLFIFFFYEKISCVQKHSQANINQQNKKAYKKQQRQRFLVHIKTPKRVVGFGAFCMREIFS